MVTCFFQLYPAYCVKKQHGEDCVTWSKKKGEEPDVRRLSAITYRNVFIFKLKSTQIYEIQQFT